MSNNKVTTEEIDKVEVKTEHKNGWIIFTAEFMGRKYTEEFKDLSADAIETAKDYVRFIIYTHINHGI